LNPKRQAEQLQEQEHAEHDQSSGPRFAQVHVPHQGVERRQASANRHEQFDQRFEERRPAPEFDSRRRIVGGTLLVGQHDLPGKQFGHPVTVRPHSRQLPRPKPQAHGGLRRDREDEKFSQPLHYGSGRAR